MWHTIDHDNYEEQQKLFGDKLLELSFKTLKDGWTHCFPTQERCKEYFLRKSDNKLYYFVDTCGNELVFLLTRVSDKPTISYLRCLGDYNYLKEIFKQKLIEIRLITNEDIYLISINDHDLTFEENLNYLEKIKEFGYWKVKWPLL